MPPSANAYATTFERVPIPLLGGGPLTLGDRYFIFINSALNLQDETLAHELHHVLFNRGDGQDTLDDSSNDTSVDKLIFSGTGLTSTNAIVTRLGSTSDLKISFGGIADSVILKSQVYSSLPNQGVESIQFSNGVTWTEAQLVNAIV